jgi:SAM-dependent methyltransferase
MTEAPDRTVACRSCGNYKLSVVLDLPRAPSSVERLLTDQQLESDTPVHLCVWRCGACGLAQLAAPMSDGFYDEYEMATSFSPRFNSYLASLATMFQDITGLRSGRLIEIGCGDGTFMDHLTRLGYQVTGIEPSRPFRRSATAKGHRVFASYIDQKTPAPDGPYDGFVLRQVLEHVHDFRGFLAGVRESVFDNAPGLVEVPNLDKALTDRRFYDFFPDHVNYFSGRTLRIVLESNGFDVDRVFPTMSDEYISAFVRKRAESDFSPTQASAAAFRRQVADFIDDQHRRGLRVAVWGSGGKGVAALAVAEPAGIEYVVDSDPRKYGLYLPASHFEVYPPEHIRLIPVDVVLVTALAHLGEIVSHLRGELAFEGRIAVLGEPIAFVD